MSRGMVGRQAVAAAAEAGDGRRSPPYGIRPDPLFHVVLLTLCATILVFATVLSVRDGSQVVVPLVNRPLPELCMLKRHTGLICPGCGLTRCFIALGQGDLSAAWAYNPAGIILFGIVALQLPLRSYQIWRIRHGLTELQTGLWGQAALLAFVVALVGQWTMRLIGVTF